MNNFPRPLRLYTFVVAISFAWFLFPPASLAQASNPALVSSNVEPTGFVLDGLVEPGYLFTQDNKFIVYLADVTGNGLFEIFSVSTSGEEPPVRLNEDLPVGATVSEAIALSPNSKKVFYYVRLSNFLVSGLFEADIETGAVTELDTIMPSTPLTPSSLQPLVSADSSKAVYLARDEGEDSLGLYSIGVGGSERIELTVPPGDGFEFAGGQISPDNTTLVYRSFGDLFGVPLDGGVPSLLTSGEATGRSSSGFQFSNNGHKVIFTASGLGNGDDEIFSVNVDGTQLTKISGDFSAGINANQFKVIEQDSLVIYKADRLYSVSTNGNNQQPLSPVTSLQVGDFEVSTDASTVFYNLTNPTNFSKTTFKVSPDGTGNTPLTANGRGIPISNLTSNDKYFVYIEAGGQFFQNALFSFELASGRRTMIAGDFNDGSSVRSFELVNGSELVLYSIVEQSSIDAQLFAVTTTGSQTTLLSRPRRGPVFSFLTSPNGLSAIFNRDRNLFLFDLGEIGDTLCIPILTKNQRVAVTCL